VCAARDPTIGDVVDRRYTLKREIDRGGIGAVFEAEHRYTGRAVAIKLLTSEHAPNPESQERLLREARALTLARHPNVVTALDAGTTEDGTPYLVMELVEGRTLAGLLASRQKLPLADAVRAAIQLCDALAFAHDRGIVHRDIKPSNIFVCRNDVGQEAIKVFDFGIASFGRESEKRTQSKLTQQGSVLGTPEYMAPEQLFAKAEVDHRSDLYAVGATLFECLAGVVPFEGNYAEVLVKVSTQSLPDVRSRCPDAPPALAAALGTALAKDPAQRFGSARDFGRALAATIDRPLSPTALLGIRRAPPQVPPPPVRPPLPGVSVSLPGFRAAPSIAGAARPRISMASARGPLPAVPVRERPQPPPLPPQPVVANTAAPEANASQRRRFARAPYVTPVRIVQQDGRSIDGKSEDISEGGLLVMADRACGAAEQVEIRFALPTTGRIVVCRAIARWVRTVRGTGALGLQFQEVSDEVRAGIRQYVTMMGGEV
jgi:eukaryotic-like serine/threonine-protein kinase